MNYYNLLCFILLGIAFLVYEADSLTTEKIINGDEASEEINYVVSVQINNQHRCGGGLIRLDLVLSAANCIFDLESGQLIHAHYTVLASYNSIIPDQNSQRVDVKKAYLHISYKPNVEYPLYNTEADIMFFELKEGLVMHYLRLLILPVNFKYHHKTFTVAGYGAYTINTEVDVETGLEIERKVYDGKLRSAKSLVLTASECSGFYPFLHKSKFCSAVQRRRHSSPLGTCSGDIGNPLVYENVVYGILASHSPDCLEIDSAAVYTRVSNYRAFLNRVIEGEHYDPELRTLTQKKTAFLGYILQ